MTIVHSKKKRKRSGVVVAEEPSAPFTDSSMEQPSQGSKHASVDSDRSLKVPNHNEKHDEIDDHACHPSEQIQFATGVPFRNCDQLFVARETLECALGNFSPTNHQGDHRAKRRIRQSFPCIPCAYKIACFDVALDRDFCQQIHNRRPEECPRAKEASYDLPNYDLLASDATIEALGYASLSSNKKPVKILTVGDGDFSFSLAIARRLLSSCANKKNKQAASGHIASSLVATSYESREKLLQVYPDINATLTELSDRYGATICFQVDATRLRETLPSHVIQSTSKEGLFDRIVWNFPCSAVAKGQDGQNAEMEHNKQLVRGFVISAKSLLTPFNGQIHMNHKTKPPFNQWKIEEAAVETNTFRETNDDWNQQRKVNVTYVGRIVLDRCLLPPYIPRKALDRKSFSVHDACTYILGLVADKRRDIPHQQENPLEIAASNGGPLVRVDHTLIQRLRTALLDFASHQKLNASFKKSKKQPR